MDESTPGITSKELAARLVAAIQETIAVGMPKGVSVTEIHAAIVSRGLVVSRETVTHWVHSEFVAGRIVMRHGRWVTGTQASVLSWDKPPQELPYEQWAAYQADGTPPGTYVPNMPDEWKHRWKAKLCGQRSAGLSELRVEIRKTVTDPGSYSVAQVVLIVRAGGWVKTSMNGTAVFSPTEIAELPIAIGEAREVMRLYTQHHPVKETA